VEKYGIVKCQEVEESEVEGRSLMKRAVKEDEGGAPNPEKKGGKAVLDLNHPPGSCTVNFQRLPK